MTRPGSESECMGYESDCASYESDCMGYECVWAMSQIVGLWVRLCGLWVNCVELCGLWVELSKSNCRIIIRSQTLIATTWYKDWRFKESAGKFLVRLKECKIVRGKNLKSCFKLKKERKIMKVCTWKVSLSLKKMWEI